MIRYAILLAGVMILSGCGSAPSLKAPASASSVSAQSKASFNTLVNATRTYLRQKFNEADRDKNGFLSAQEAGAAGGGFVLGQETIGRFAEVDTNRDGKLSFEEFGASPIIQRIAQRLHGQLVQMFVAADRDSDMELRGSEIPPGYDLNKDGCVTFEEYEMAYAATVAQGDRQ